MRREASRAHDPKQKELGFSSSRSDSQWTGENNTNSVDEIIGEMGLVLVVVLGIVLAINLLLTSLHIA